MSIITMTTDFGTRDYYVGTMKGVILSIHPGVRLVDLTHEIEKQAVAEAAIVLKSSRAFFPPGTVHLAVVDPGVGGARRPVVLQSGGQLFVGPDNGIFTFVLEPGHRAWALEAPRYRLGALSDTFHGRDIFAPAAAHLSGGAKPETFGPEVAGLVEIETRKPMAFRDRVLGEVIHVDSFGNLITNFPRSVLAELAERGPVQIELSGRVIRGVSRTYSDVPPGQLVAVFGGTELLEIAVRDGDAHRKLGMGRGDPVKLTIGG